jgi:hypothetical protein
LKQVAFFASDQLGFWRGKWFFSPAHSPNTIARVGTVGWRLIFRACSDALVERVPEVRGQLKCRHNLILVQHW